jgi:D-alanyl-D-alanine carboxypeptidase/D-alanyl-D-alanine-endopeptidase (penicillin-binding protein 4)
MRFCSPRPYCLMLLMCAATAFAQTSAPQANPASQTVPAPPAPFPTGLATPLGQQVAALTAEPAVARAHWGIAVTAMDGTPIYGLNEGEFFRPASNAKLFTTAAAMHLLGPQTRLTTSVESASMLPDGTAPKDGVIHGNLVLSGAGDANLSARLFPYISNAERKRRAAALTGEGATAIPPNPLRYIDSLADDIAKAHVRRITGDIVGDDTQWSWEPYANDWTIDDAIWGYGAPVSALTITDNQLDLTVKPAAAPGKAATVELFPDTGYYQIRSTVQTVAAKSAASIRIDRDIGSRLVRVVGTVAVGEPYSTEIAIEDPAEFAAQALKQSLEAHGIKVAGKAIAHHREAADTAGFSDQSHAPLPALPRETAGDRSQTSVCLDDCPLRVEHVSPTLGEDVIATLKVSQNLHAELFLRRLGKAYGTDGSAAQGTRVVRQFLVNAGLDGDDFIFYDGSGLSGHDLVTPRATAKLLAYATHQPWFAQWRAGFPVGGEDGTLAGRFAKPPLKDHLFAKTGTLAEARALSGYVDCASGKTVIFSIMVDNHAPNTPADRDVMDNIVAAIAANN